jgi:recombination protein RecA
MAREAREGAGEKAGESNAKAKANAEKAKALDTALAQIERQYGKGSVMRMGERRADWRSTSWPRCRNLWP